MKNPAIMLDDWLLQKFQSFTEWFQILTGRNCYWLSGVSRLLQTCLLGLAVVCMFFLFPTVSTYGFGGITLIFLGAIITYRSWEEYSLAQRFFRIAKSGRMRLVGHTSELRMLILLLVAVFVPLFLASTSLLYSYGLRVFGLYTLTAAAGIFNFFPMVYIDSCLPLPPEKLRKRQKKFTTNLEPQTA